MSSRGRAQVVALLARFSVRLVVSSASLLDRVSQEAGSLGMMDYEGEYLTQGQRWGAVLHFIICNNACQG